MTMKHGDASKKKLDSYAYTHNAYTRTYVHMRIMRACAHDNYVLKRNEVQKDGRHRQSGKGSQEAPRLVMLVASVLKNLQSQC